MSQLLIVGDITAISNQHVNGSELLLFKRNKDFLGRIVLQEKGELLRQSLEYSIRRILRTVIPRPVAIPSIKPNSSAFWYFGKNE